MKKSVNVVSPRYRQIAADIAAKIVDRQYQVGDKVYSRSLIAGQYFVSAETARRAIAVLSDMDIVETVKGSGVVIKSYENALHFVKLNQETSTIQNLRRDAVEQLSRLLSEGAALKEKVDRLVEHTTELKSTNPFIPYEAVVGEGSACLGKSISELSFWQSTSATIVAVGRGDALILSPGPYEVFQQGDVVYFVGSEDSFSRAAAFLRAEARA